MSNQHTQMKRSGYTSIASLGVGFAILCWGGAYVAARFLLAPGASGTVPLSPLVLAAVRFSIASLVFVFPVAKALSHRQVSGSTLLRMSLLGLLTFTVYYWLQYLGIQRTSAGIASILGVGLIPLCTTLLAPLFGAERLTARLVGALLIGFFGVALIVFQQSWHILIQSGFLLGAGCFIANTFFFACYNNVSKRWMRQIDPTILTGWTMISGTFGLVLLSLVDPASHWSALVFLNVSQWIAILFLAIFCSVVAYFMYNRALSIMDASRVTVYFYFEPVVSLVLSNILLNERPSWQTLLGALVISGAVLAVNWMA